MKKFWAIVLSVFMTLTFGLSLVGCKTENKAEATSFVSVDINPSIEFTLDANNKVISVCGTNDDGRVLLYGEASLVGLDIETAVEKVTQLAIELGYLNEDNKVVDLSVCADTEQLEDTIKGKVSAKIVATASQLSVTVSNQGAYSLIRKYEQFIADHPECNLSVEQFKLALSAYEAGKISLEKAVTLQRKQLVKLISDAHKELSDYVTIAFEKAIAEAETEYLNDEDEIMASLYYKYSPTKFAMYTNYKIKAGLLKMYASKFYLSQKVDNYPLPETMVEQIATVLGMEDLTAFKNIDGEITISGVYDCIDNYFKNAIDSQEIEQLKVTIDGYLKTIESDIDQLIENDKTFYLQEVIKAIDDKIIPGIEFVDGLSTEEIEKVAKHFDKLAEDLALEIEKELTDNQKAELKIYKEDIKKRIQQSKEQMMETINNLKTEAQNKLEEIKESLRQPK